MNAHVYDNAVAPANVYGHALELIRAQSELRGVHLDIGCSFGRIAEPLAETPGLTYVGIDGSPDGLGSLKARGFECHQHELRGSDEDFEFIQRVLNGRTLRSISILDALEHLTAPEEMLKFLRRIAEPSRAPLIVSVPNVAHRDVGFKLAFGRWDYTDAGLLDRTHLKFFTPSLLERMSRSTGWREVAANDVLLAESDQHFPSGHLAVARGSAIHGFLDRLRSNIPAAQTNQFVRAYEPVEPTNESFLESHTQSRRPFLSIVTRTQGRRIDTLREVFLCLSAQTDRDFEVIVVGHRLGDRRAAVEAVLADCDDEMRRRTRLVLVNTGNRTTPLNVGFAEAQGEYISILDDDDIPFAHWVEEFRRLAEQFPGRMLRTVAVRQEFEEVQTVYGKKSVRAVSGMKRDYPPRFDLFRQLLMNLTPNTALAFPRSAFHDLGLRFDESLTTTEDWDFLMRVAFISDVASSESVTCVYRWWTKSESSRTAHDETEWQANLDRILAKFDQEYIVLPPGSASKLRHLMLEGSEPSLGGLSDEPNQRDELIALLHSAPWMATWGIREIGHLLGNPKPLTAARVLEMSNGEVQSTLAAVSNSKSMRIGRALKSIGTRLGLVPRKRG